jgi:hypothetical protein
MIRVNPSRLKIPSRRAALQSRKRKRRRRRAKQMRLLATRRSTLIINSQANISTK